LLPLEVLVDLFVIILGLIDYANILGEGDLVERLGEIIVVVGFLVLLLPGKVGGVSENNGAVLLIKFSIILERQTSSSSSSRSGRNSVWPA
jgi:hypothetical protein